MLHDGQPADELDWDRIVAATIAGDDVAVAASVVRLGLDAASWTGEDAIVLVIVDGRAHVARRLGPAKAEILSVAVGGRPQHVGDLVAFDPQPVGAHTGGDRAPDGADAAEGPLHWHAFRALAVLRPGNRQVWTAHGDDPGAFAWEDAVADLRSRGWTLRRCGRADDDLLLGAVSIPSEIEPADVGRVLAEVTTDWPSPVQWDS